MFLVESRGTFSFWSECYKLRFFTLNFVESLTDIIKICCSLSSCRFWAIHSYDVTLTMHATGEKMLASEIVCALIVNSTRLMNFQLIGENEQKSVEFASVDMMGTWGPEIINDVGRESWEKLTEVAESHCGEWSECKLNQGKPNEINWIVSNESCWTKLT